jgi:hypothetical protein
MRHRSARHEFSSVPSRRTRLFKADRPRAIDRYIDYFGGRPGYHRDTCGEALLDAMDAENSMNELPQAASNA